MPYRVQDTAAPRSLWRAMRRGFARRCPACGVGRLFHNYLTVDAACGHCGEALHHQRADDAPPYFTIVLVGHLIVPTALMLEQYSHPPTWVHYALWLPLTLAMTLLLLPRIKGAVIGGQWAGRMHGFGESNDL